MPFYLKFFTFNGINVFFFPYQGCVTESDLDYELEGCDEPPPAYDELQVLAIAQRKETAI